MRKAHVIRSFLALATLTIAVDRGAAAELRLRSQSSPAGPVVTLGDVADIASTDARQSAALAAIELFPAPTATEEKRVRVREIQDLLLLRGVNLAEHQFSGSSEVAIRAAARPPVAAVRPVSTVEIQRVKRRLSDALVKYLNEHTATQQDRSLDFELTEATARLVADPVAPIQITGGSAPWTGSQRFEILVTGPQGPAHASIDATVRVIAPVVVAVHPLTRGTVVREGDVALQRPASGYPAAAEKLPGALHSLDEALGHELVRAVGTGSPVTSDALRPPLVVHRGEVVSVLARAGGIRIRTNARSRDEGSVGDLVAVESLLNRSTYYARVSGTRQVEVYARPPQVENER
jgi:flagella basal body P-ring formation protein FlgA